MPGAMRKMGVYLGLVEDDDDGQYSDARYDGDRYDDRYDDDRSDRAERADRDDRYDRSERTSRSERASRAHDDSWDDYDGHERAERPGGSRRDGRPAATLAREWGDGAEVRSTGRHGGAVATASRPLAASAASAVSGSAFATPSAATVAYQITTLHPRTYNEARQIGEHYRVGTPVIMNLSEMDDADAKRLVDFAAGLTFGLHGRLERVTAKVFLLSPQNVTVTAEDRARIVESGFFNQS